MSMFVVKVPKCSLALRQTSLFNSRVIKWTVAKCLTVTKSFTATPKVNHVQNGGDSRVTKTIRDIPGPSMLESLATFARHKAYHHHVFIEEMFERYGPIFKHRLPGIMSIVYVSDPVDIEHVYRSQEGYNPYRGDLTSTDYCIQAGLDKGIAGDDESWYFQRKIIATKLLTVGALRPYFTELVNVVDDTIANFKDGRNLDLEDHIRRFTAESIGVILFGLRMGTNSKSPNERAMIFIKSVNDYFEDEAKIFLSGFPLHKYVKTPTLRNAFRNFDIQMDISRQFIDETRNETTELAGISIVSKLMKDDNLSEKVLLQICNGLFIGGIHTTASAATDLFHLLSRHPEAQRKAYEEIQQVVGENNQPTYEHLTKMPYIRALIKESFRYSSNPLGNIRVLKQPITVRGYHIPPGTKVILSTIASKEMQKQKFGDPEKFAPERWLHSAEIRPHPFSNIPLGFGKRLCVGKRVTELEISLLFLRLLQKYEIVENKSPEDQVNWHFKMMIIPDRPYPFHLKQRS